MQYWKKVIHYAPRSKQYSRQLRTKGTLGEVLIWRRVKNRQICGQRFLRQRPLGPYIVDFFCPALMLAIEINGSSHINKYESDVLRQRYLEGLGIRVILFSEARVRFERPAVIETIEKQVSQRMLELGVGLAENTRNKIRR